MLRGKGPVSVFAQHAGRGTGDGPPRCDAGNGGTGCGRLRLVLPGGRARWRDGQAMPTGSTSST